MTQDTETSKMYVERINPITGRGEKKNLLNKKKLTSWELDQIFLEDDYND